jgi:hypothetical protein
MNDDVVWCELLQAWVLACDCGPHQDRPEHLFNCVIDPTAPPFVNGQTVNS